MGMGMGMGMDGSWSMGMDRSRSMGMDGSGSMCMDGSGSGSMGMYGSGSMGIDGSRSMGMYGGGSMGMNGSGSSGISLRLSTISRPIGLSEVKVVVLLLRRVDRLSWVRCLGFFCLGLLLLLFGELDDTASDCFALTFAGAAFTIVRLWMFVLVEVIISFVKND